MRPYTASVFRLFLPQERLKRGASAWESPRFRRFSNDLIITLLLQKCKKHIANSPDKEYDEPRQKSRGGVRMSNITVAQRIRQIRETHGMTLEQLAAKIDVDPSTLSRYESTDTRKIAVSVIQRICSAVGITLPDFFRGMEEPKYQAVPELDQFLGFDEIVLLNRIRHLPPPLKKQFLQHLDYLEYLKKQGGLSID
jgi:transcriptional regulator with XRE-family HTH domain